MTTSNDFSADDWQLIKNVPILAGIAVMVGGKTSTGTIKESSTLMQAAFAGRQDYPDDELITSILSEDEWDDSATAEMNQEFVGMPPDQIVENILEQCRQAVALLSSMATPSEIADYTSWTYTVAVSVAKASKEGGILGFGGVRISEAEKDTLSKLASALGLEDSEIP